MCRSVGDTVRLVPPVASVAGCEARPVRASAIEATKIARYVPRRTSANSAAMRERRIVRRRASASSRT